jgi:hypothetical protein
MRVVTTTTGIVAGIASLCIVITGTTAQAAPTVKVPKFKNCTALNKAYPHGVALAKTTKDSTTSKRVTTFKVNKAVYAANKGLDRDKDGIACEKR